MSSNGPQGATMEYWKNTSSRHVAKGQNEGSTHISLWIRSMLMEVGGNTYFQKRYHDMSWFWENIASPWVIQRTYDL